VTLKQKKMAQWAVLVTESKNGTSDRRKGKK